jgi:long-chain acyl-CoA synthetase
MSSDGGSAETLVTAPTVRPRGRPSASTVVTTVIVAGAVPMMSKKVRLSIAAILPERARDAEPALTARSIHGPALHFPAMTEFPHASDFGSLVELLDDAAARWPADRVMYSLHTDHGRELSWSAQEMQRRSLLAAWRLRALGFEAGDRLMTWSPSTPNLPAVYWGAMRAGVVVVPIDLRMTKAVVERIASVAEVGRLAVDEGYDAPDPAEVGLEGMDIHKLAELTADPEDDWPDDWEAQVRSWPQPDRDTLFEIHFTSGTTAAPKGVLLTHGNFLHSMGLFTELIEVRHLRTVSILPLSHLLEQIGTLFAGTMLGAEVVYMRTRNTRVVFEIFRELRVNALVVTPQVLELFWSGLMREVRKRRFGAFYIENARKIARHLPYRLRRLLFRPVHAPLGGALEWVVSAGAYLPPDLQLAWEDLGIVVFQGYGSTEVGFAVACDEWYHPPGLVGRAHPGIDVRIDPETSEIQVRGDNVSPGYWRDEESTRASRTEDGWYRMGDTGHFNEDGYLKLSGRLKNMIVLPNGLNVFPEDIEEILADHGLAQAVVLETDPGRIEAVVLPPGAVPIIRADQEAANDREMDGSLRAEIDALVKAANADLSMHQRIAAWRLWPERDFPRTHTMKIKRNPVREWVGSDAALQVHETE